MDEFDVLIEATNIAGQTQRHLNIIDEFKRRLARATENEKQYRRMVRCSMADRKWLAEAKAVLEGDAGLT